MLGCNGCPDTRGLAKAAEVFFFFNLASFGKKYSISSHSLAKCSISNFVKFQNILYTKVLVGVKENVRDESKINT